jgi:threonyl-tRNA synthetase
MVHRAIFGSIERFFGILVENTAGDFPLWLSPVQLRLLPVTDAAKEHAQGIKARLAAAGIRVEVDSGSERLGKQIRNAEQARVPVMGIVGAKEVETGGVTLRTRLGGQLGLFSADEVLLGMSAAVGENKELHEVLEARPEPAKEKEE